MSVDDNSWYSFLDAGGAEIGCLDVPGRWQEKAEWFAEGLEWLAEEFEFDVEDAEANRPDCRSVGVGTEADFDGPSSLAEVSKGLSELEAAEAELARWKALAEDSSERLDSAKKALAASREAAARKAEIAKMEARQAAQGRRLAQEKAARDREATMRRSFQAREAEEEAKIAQIKARDVACLKELAELRAAMTAVEERQRKACAKLDAPPPDEALKEAEETERALAEQLRNVEELTEEQDAIKEEAGSLRFALKEQKSFRHRQLQELDNKVKRLERQKRRLDQERAAKLKQQEAAGSEQTRPLRTKLKQLQDLGELLKGQLSSAKEKLTTNKELVAKLRRENEEHNSAWQRVPEMREQTESLTEVEIAMQGEARTLRQLAQTREKAVTMLVRTTQQKRYLCSMTEASLENVRKEEQDSERKAEILQWKLQAGKHIIGSQAQRVLFRGGTQPGGGKATSDAVASSEPSSTGPDPGGPSCSKEESSVVAASEVSSAAAVVHDLGDGVSARLVQLNSCQPNSADPITPPSSERRGLLSSESVEAAAVAAEEEEKRKSADAFKAKRANHSAPS